MAEDLLKTLGLTLHNDWQAVMDGLVQDWLADAPLRGDAWQALRLLENDVAHLARQDAELAAFVAWLTTGYVPEELAGALETEPVFSGDEDPARPETFGLPGESRPVRDPLGQPPEEQAASPDRSHLATGSLGSTGNESAARPVPTPPEVPAADQRRRHHESPPQDGPLPTPNRHDTPGRPRAGDDEKNDPQAHHAAKTPKGLAGLAAYLRTTDAAFPQTTPSVAPTAGTDAPEADRPAPRHPHHEPPSPDSPPPTPGRRDMPGRTRAGDDEKNDPQAHHAAKTRKGLAGLAAYLRTTDAAFPQTTPSVAPAAGTAAPPARNDTAPPRPETLATGTDAHPDRRQDVPFISAEPGAARATQTPPKKAEPREADSHNPEVADSAWSTWMGFGSRDETAAWAAQIRAVLSLPGAARPGRPTGASERSRPSQPERGYPPKQAAPRTAAGTPPHPDRPMLQPFTEMPTAPPAPPAWPQQPAGKEQAFQERAPIAPTAGATTGAVEDAAFEIDEVLDALTQEILDEYRRFYGV